MLSSKGHNLCMDKNCTRKQGLVVFFMGLLFYTFSLSMWMFNQTTASARCFLYRQWSWTLYSSLTEPGSMTLNWNVEHWLTGMLSGVDENFKPCTGINTVKMCGGALWSCPTWIIHICWKKSYHCHKSSLYHVYRSKVNMYTWNVNVKLRDKCIGT